ncbi:MULTISPECIES: precorrin-2 C(20)-methyltransferase [unclassified Herbaspirillum]|uniref:precorrin-2 C(20)-methyltransferase n=1 Tax=unclassified Herbaspirillum TaxID=2624150 RepID=UPI000E2EDA64|nr:MULTISPECIES: precorrin-2 C(20)-methyltransferase [unclassified Herbaspirillum]RFB73283.1 precorrin-2 C(20)-methyltransferase [Herbaspirillum sp. 3R-3a1]TFI10908.1 precorrin-2 C(20)-methyltransferase [Herbaspirillum sp. 3R11]TFI16816.1 precorrin-2 C(20)-methyltransferase [Herbaspirillum sp. 3R-11]TFI26399.1 precorrin-2 C(20)-methyltransferase [Herbaspirillum sp. 3C11]TFI26432.1 precorrin-2 C(20)-methyltransferase [Herbaspirillum sp. 3C11]
MKAQPGMFWGIGVGPGPAGYLPLAAMQALQNADLIYVPRAKSADTSVALQCLEGVAVAPERLREVEFNMDPDRNVLREHYAQLAQDIAAELQAGRSVAYLTIGDTLTYSTYGYILAALKDLLPVFPHRTFPGITSYASAAAALDWPLGVGKERTLILPCPDDPATLQQEIETHDIVVLMKVGARLPWVLALLKEMGIAGHCAFARRIGLDGEVLANDLRELEAGDRDHAVSGYLATMLIRKTALEKRHQG